MIEKTTVTQDELYEFLLAHNVTTMRLGELIGLTDVSLCSCFKHHKNNSGRPRRFTPKQIADINSALPKMAREISNRRVTFNAANNTSKSEKRMFDPGCVEQFKRVGEYFSLTALTVRLLGWSKQRKSIVINAPGNGSYGHITPDDVDRINAELQEVSNWLLGHEVIPNDSDGDNTADFSDAATANTKKGTRARMEQSFESKAQAWDDTTLPLAERCALFHAERPGGVLFFRVNDGYTVAQDDAALVSSWDHTITPYTDHSTGLTTAYMSAEKFDALLPRCVQENHRVGITDMYAE